MLLPEGIRRADDSPMRITALKIVAMREAGVSEEGIASELGLSPKTIAGYVHKAGRNGWLEFNDPKDTLEYQLMHKVVRNLDEALDDTTRHVTSGIMVKTAVAEKIAEGALYPRLANQQVAQGNTLVGIKIQIVGGDPGTMREGTIMGNSTYVDAETVEEK
jgi:predicted transcriptional regulator